MTYTIADGKFPKKPEYGRVLESCYKDFKKFKKDNENRFDDLLELYNQHNNEMESNGTLQEELKNNLEIVKTFLREGREDVAFSLFYRSFPTCLPHRTRNNIENNLNL